MKKYLALLLALTMIFGLVACNSATPDNSSQGADNNPESNAPAGVGTKTFDTGWTGLLEEGLPKFKIALVYGQFTDKLGMQMKNSMEYLAEAFNIEFVFVEFGANPEDQLANIESALQNGVQGVISVGGTPPILEACKKAGNVPFVMVQAEPTTADVAAELATYENYLGAVCENDYDVGYRAVEALYADGARNFCIAGITKGLSKTHDQRAQAAIDFIAAHDDTKLLADDYSYGLWAEAVTSFAASFPEMDGLFVTGGMESVYQVMQTEGLTGRVHYATIDVSDSTGSYLASGDLSWIAGGQYGTTMVGFAVLYNYLIDNTRIITESAVTLYRPFLEINSVEDYETYVKYVDGGIPVYSIGEVANMIHYFNADANFTYFDSLAKNYSIDDIATRHTDLIK